MDRRVVGVVVALAVCTAGPSLIAHHSFAAEYDRDKPVTLQGTVTRIEWMNPHIYFYIDVKEASGETVNWAIEGGAPTSLYRAGWRKDNMKVGDTVTVHGYLARPFEELEFDVPAAATAGGALTLEWAQEPGGGGTGRGCAVAEVWLFRKPEGR